MKTSLFTGALRNSPAWLSTCSNQPLSQAVLPAVVICDDVKPAVEDNQEYYQML